jgi:hypothetical protein
MQYIVPVVVGGGGVGGALYIFFGEKVNLRFGCRFQSQARLKLLERRTAGHHSVTIIIQITMNTDDTYRTVWIAQDAYAISITPRYHSHPNQFTHLHPPTIQNIMNTPCQKDPFQRWLKNKPRTPDPITKVLCGCATMCPAALYTANV